MAERSLTEDVIWSAMNVAEGVGFRTIAANVIGMPEPVAQVIGVGVPSMIAWLAGLPVLPAALGAVVGSGGSYIYEKVTMTPRRFLFWSDSHGRESVHEAVMTRMLREEGSDFAVFGGDAEDWTSWDRVTRPLRDKMPVYAVRGNHDSPDQFGSRFRYSTPHMIEEGAAEVWLLSWPPKREECERVSRMMRAGRQPKIVVCHTPPYAFANTNVADANRAAVAMGPLLSKGVTVLSGHQHVFAWTNIGRSNVVTAGIAGSKHYSCNPGLPQRAVCDDRVRGYLRVLVSDKGVSAELVPVDVGEG